MSLVASLFTTVLIAHAAPSPAAAPTVAHGSEDGRWVAQVVRAPGAVDRRRLIKQSALKNMVRRNPALQALRNRRVQGAGAAVPPPHRVVGSRPAPPPPGPRATSSVPVTKGPLADKGIDYLARAKHGKFSFEFSKAQIIDIVKAISDMTRKNFIIPEKLKSQRITILSPTKITAAEAYQVFLAALAINGITVVRAGKFYKLMDAKDAMKTTIPTCVGPDDKCPEYSEVMVTEIVHLKYIDANQVSGVLKPLISKEGEMTVFQPTNALIVSEYAPNLQRIRHIIDSLDQPGFDDELQIVQIQYATASDIADKLTQIFDVEGHGNTNRPVPRPRGLRSKRGMGLSAGGTAEVQISKIIADDRTNQIIIKANRRSFAAIKQLIAKLDVPITGDEQGRVHVYYLENASAEDLASTLSSLAQGSQNHRNNQPGRRGHAPGQHGATSASLFEGDVKITADKATNSLIIMASAHDFRALKGIIEKLDRPRQQVYVEVAILEVDVSGNDNAGLSWHAPLQFNKNDLGSLGAGSVGFLQSAQNSSGISPTLLPLTDPSALVNLAGGAVGGLIGKAINIPVNGGDLSIPSFGILLKWLQSSNKANVLSTPHILTTDNEEASIEVGKKIPFRNGTAIPNLGSLGTATGASNQLSQLSSLGSLFSSVQRIDVSLKLDIKPTINERNKIKLQIQQDVENVAGTDQQTGQPITTKRSAKTTVVVDDQQTVVLGGLMTNRVTSGESKIPILGDLPLIGWLFKEQNHTTEKVNLLLVLTPYIIRNANDFQKIFERKIKQYEEFAADYYGNTPQYRAYIDYSRKNGPLAELAAAVQREKEKYENGGSGDSSELLITPSSKGNAGPSGSKAPGASSGSGSGAPSGPTPVAPTPPKSSSEAP